MDYPAYEGTGETLHFVPWLPHLATKFLHETLKPTDIVFEWGSGGSTIFFMKHVLKVISIEHHKEWYRRIRDLTQLMGEFNYKNSDLRFIPPEEGSKVTPQMAYNPDNYCCCSTDYTTQRWVKYATVIDLFDNDSLDLIMVDGVARASCVKHAIPKVKPGGYLMFDNIDDGQYNDICCRFMNNWKRTDFFGDGSYFASDIKWKTSVWQRPN